MRVFLTGATGYIGSAVLDALLRGGHDVTALVRDRAKAERVSRRGVLAVVGDLTQPATYAGHAEVCDGTIHAAVDHSKRGEAVDRTAIETLLPVTGTPVEGGDGRRPFFLYTSSIWVIGATAEPAVEDAPLNPALRATWHADHERVVLDAGAAGSLRTAVVRPGIVYGGARGIIADLFKDATNGLVRVIGTGEQHWPCVYDRDVADLFVRLAVQDDASGVYHATDEADERVGDIVEAIAGYVRTRPDIRYMPIEEARAKMGAYADALALDQQVRSPRARALGWTPTLRSVAGSVARLMEEYRSAREAA